MAASNRWASPGLAATLCDGCPPGAWENDHHDDEGRRLSGTAAAAVTNEQARSFWERHPVGAEAVDAEPGSAAFFAAFDALREAEECEPYAFSNRIHGYDRSAGKQVLDIGCGNGDACPLAKVYGRAELRTLLAGFADLRFSVNQLSWKQLLLVPPLARLLTPLLPSCSGSFFARRLGWNLYAHAVKPG
jgi:hypothetical protein